MTYTWVPTCVYVQHISCMLIVIFPKDWTVLDLLYYYLLLLLLPQSAMAASLDKTKLRVQRSNSNSNKSPSSSTLGVSNGRFNSYNSYSTTHNRLLTTVLANSLILILLILSQNGQTHAQGDHKAERSLGESTARPREKHLI